MPIELGKPYWLKPNKSKDEWYLVEFIFSIGSTEEDEDPWYDIIDTETDEIRWASISESILDKYFVRGDLYADKIPDPEECNSLNISILFE